MWISGLSLYVYMWNVIACDVDDIEMRWLDVDDDIEMRWFDVDDVIEMNACCVCTWGV